MQSMDVGSWESRNQLIGHPLEATAQTQSRRTEQHLSKETGGQAGKKGCETGREDESSYL